MRDILCLVAALVALTSSSPSIAAEKLKAVASFSILADLVKQVGGDRVDVTAIVGPDGDAHVFQPSPLDAKAVADANIVVINGLGLEGWMARLIQSSGTKAPVVVASKGVRPLQGEGEEKGKADPHAWQSIANAKIYVANIRDGLIAADPADKADFEKNAKDYLVKLDQLETEVKAAIASIPPKNRKIITTHDAFGYFARAYGMTFIAPQGVSTETEPSAKDVAKIIRQVKAQHVPAVFLENISDDRLMQQIARETGAKTGDKLYSDALSKPGAGAATYVDMMHNNIAAFTKALKE
ncbi:MAG: zinc/manganese transport system substrate-binding protein [Methylobacteriaceae bacterium]|jgi:zinc/manganese transport system substrate-binding protein|nr:zinc/manganese transport system substrate-binding protein [Methylobacteriaceae bacterium]